MLPRAFRHPTRQAAAAVLLTTCFVAAGPVPVAAAARTAVAAPLAKPASTLLDAVAPVTDPVVAPVDAALSTPLLQPSLDDVAAQVDDVAASAAPPATDGSLDGVVAATPVQPDGAAAISAPARRASTPAAPDEASRAGVSGAAAPVVTMRVSSTRRGLAVARPGARIAAANAPVEVRAFELDDRAPTTVVGATERATVVSNLDDRSQRQPVMAIRRTPQSPAHEDQGAGASWASSSPVACLTTLATGRPHGTSLVGRRSDPARAPPAFEVPTQPG